MLYGKQEARSKIDNISFHLKFFNVFNEPSMQKLAIAFEFGYIFQNIFSDIAVLYEQADKGR